MAPGALSSVDALADEYRRHNTAAVVFTVDARTGMRHMSNSIEDLIAGAVRNNDVLIPFGSVDPWHERRAVHRVHELVREYGVKVSNCIEHAGLRAEQPQVLPDLRGDHRGRCARRLFHTGQTGIGAGLPAGTASNCGTRIRCCSTMSPPTSELTIVMAHPGCRGSTRRSRCYAQDQRLHRPVGLVAEYFRRSSCAPQARQLRTKVLFGSDFPRSSSWTAGAVVSPSCRSRRR